MTQEKTGLKVKHKCKRCNNFILGYARVCQDCENEQDIHYREEQRKYNSKLKSLRSLKNANQC